MKLTKLSSSVDVEAAKADAFTETTEEVVTSSPTFPLSQEKPSAPVQHTETRKAAFANRSSSNNNIKKGGFSMAMASFVSSASKMGSIFTEKKKLY